MRKLLQQIKCELKTAKHCAVYEEELSRVWPAGNQREPKVRRFADDNGFRLRFYRDGLSAIFDKGRRETDRERERERERETDFSTGTRTNNASGSDLGFQARGLH